METKTERVRCGTESRYIKEFENFGWTFSSKQLLNKFGNPLPLNHGLSNEEIMAKTMNEDELAQVTGGTRIETYELIKFYKSKGVKMPSNLEAAARQACILVNRDLNISVALNIQDNSEDSKNSYYDRNKKYSHAEIMDMLHKKYGK